MARNLTSRDLTAILSGLAPALSAALGGRAGTFEAQTGPVPAAHIRCEDVTIRCYIERDGRSLLTDIVFPCAQFGTHRRDVCEADASLLLEVLNYGFDLKSPPAPSLRREDGVVVDALDVQFNAMFEKLAFLANHLLFDQHRRDLAAAYASGYRGGYTIACSGHVGD